MIGDQQRKFHFLQCFYPMRRMVFLTDFHILQVVLQFQWLCIEYSWIFDFLISFQCIQLLSDLLFLKVSSLIFYWLLLASTQHQLIYYYANLLQLFVQLKLKLHIMRICQCSRMFQVENFTTAILCGQQHVIYFFSTIFYVIVTI